jgi:hypothetical protein
VQLIKNTESRYAHPSYTKHKRKRKRKRETVHLRSVTLSVNVSLTAHRTMDRTVKGVVSPLL